MKTMQPHERGFDKSVKFIEEETGLSYRYILKSIDKLETIFQGHYDKDPSHNGYLFDSTALQYYKRIAELKEQGHDIRYIRRDLEKTLPQPKLPVKAQPVTHETDSEIAMESVGNQVGKPSDTLQFSQMMEQWRGDILNVHQEKERLIREHAREKETLKSELSEARNNFERLQDNLSNMEKNIKLLTDGQEPHQVKIAEVKRQSKREQLLNELLQLQGQLFKGKRKKQLIEEIKQLDKLSPQELLQLVS